MRADYDSTANAISISIADTARAERSDGVHPRAVVALVAERYGLDHEALAAAAQSALAAPDRLISLEVAARSAA